MGDAASVGLVPAEDVRLLIPAMVQDGLQAEVVYSGPLAAPIVKGAQVAELVISIPGLPEQRIALVAETDVGRGGFVTRITTAARHLQALYFGDGAAAS